MTVVAPTTEGRERQTRTVLAAAWVVLLLVSALPDIPLLEFAGEAPPWFFWGKVALLAVGIVAGLAWPPLRPLRQFFAMLLVIYLAEHLRVWGEMSALWQGWFGGASASFTQEMPGIQLMRLALALMGALLALRFRPGQFHLAKGDLAAPAEPVRWLGLKQPEPWTRLGRNLAVFVSLGTLAFLLLAGRPSLPILARALPLLPAVLVFAAMNSFGEGVTYKASLLAPLGPVVGKSQALLLTAALFGLGHYTGVPYGVAGVVMAGFLGWLMATSMWETKGLFRAWFIHFLQDVLIFSSMGIGSIVAGRG
ncbi:MAG: CPBP family intramembrane metalloprotease [Chloroflexi bacterium]|nr:CPBP family intramembrane metalloprotease [Chloroflexota bacterium]